MTFDPAIDVKVLSGSLGFAYGPGVFGPPPELRSIDSIRWSLLDRECNGPDPVYAIAMDVGKIEDRPLLVERNLLFGVVTYATGRLGREPVRSRGHSHALRAGKSLTAPEIYEIWSGKALIYMQETGDDDPGRCFAVEAGPGDIVVVPPGWTHMAVSGDQNRPLTFAALCEREYGFDYDKIRAHHGPAWYPILRDDGNIEWIPNEYYRRCELTTKKPGDYTHLDIRKGKALYETFEENPDIFLYVENPELRSNAWETFVP